MVRVVDADHFLTDGDLPHSGPLPFRRQALIVARFIEYAGPIEQGSTRETLIECQLRPRRRPCRGLLWVRKSEEDRIEAFCPKCESLQYVISNWRQTLWADGPMAPIPSR
jgi:hypothetical protein